jgi:magnesium-transporting ATPase (P-type)
MQSKQESSPSKDTKRAFWAMMIALVFGVILCANILFGAITLIVVEGYSNFSFWNIIVGAMGLMLCLTFIYDGFRRMRGLKKDEK